MKRIHFAKMLLFVAALALLASSAYAKQITLTGDFLAPKLNGNCSIVAGYKEYLSNQAKGSCEATRLEIDYKYYWGKLVKWHVATVFPGSCSVRIEAVCTFGKE